jgi:hypothetical protein
VGKAKAMARFGVLAAFAFPTSVRRLRDKAEVVNADNSILCLSTMLCGIGFVSFSESNPIQRAIQKEIQKGRKLARKGL